MTRDGGFRETARHEQGHTLWEMLLVLTLLGLVAALVAPASRFVRPRADDVGLTTHDIVALLDRARLTALERGVTVELHLDPASGRAWIFARDVDSLRLVGNAAIARVSAVDVLAASPRARFVFTAAGGAFGEPITVRGVGGARRISIDTWTGGAHVSRR